MYAEYDHESEACMKIPYTSCILRYHHDAVTGEFINVGVVVYGESERFLRAKCTRSIWRACHFFTGTGPSPDPTFLVGGPNSGSGENSIDVDGFLRVVKHAEDRINAMGVALANRLPMVMGSLGSMLDALLVRTDDGIRFSPIMAGVGRDLREVLDVTYRRSVGHYESAPDTSILRAPAGDGDGGKPAYVYIRYRPEGDKASDGDQNEPKPTTEPDELPAYAKFRIEGSTLAELFDRRDVIENTRASLQEELRAVNEEAERLASKP